MSEPAKPRLSTEALVTATLFLMAAVIILWFGYNAMRAFLLLFAGTVLATLICGLTSALGKFSPLPRRANFTLVVVLLIGGFVGAAYFFGPVVVDEIRKVVGQIPAALDELQQSRFGPLIFQEAPESAENSEDAPIGSGLAIGERIVDQVMAQAAGWAMAALNVVTALVLITFVALFLSSSPEYYRRGIISIFPMYKREAAYSVVDATGRALKSWLVGQAFAMTLIAILTSIALFIIDLPYALTLGILAGVFQFIPYFGPTLFLVPGLAVGLAEGPDKALAVFVVYSIIQLVEGNVITPLVLKKEAYLPPVISLLATVAAGLVFGIVGVILASPLAVVLLAIYQKAYQQEYIGDRQAIVPGEQH
ncbi:MAG: AI-2E family transporter [Opitutales bacterium]